MLVRIEDSGSGGSYYIMAHTIEAVRFLFPGPKWVVSEQRLYTFEQIILNMSSCGSLVVADPPPKVGG